ncbi:MAG: HIT domain-containing protein [Gammaproteobacteria bacterium]|nr:MAG: HIT domain-containing protein [Gammaproteobacteria bacterium]
MNTFKLHPQLQNDCHMLGKLELSRVLLMNNALVPWLILVPETDITEFHRLGQMQQLQLLSEINLVSGFIENNFSISKLNTATIGNIVRQMHIHIIGRHEHDFCWPGVVWGRSEKQAYDTPQLEQIRTSWNQWLMKIS